MWFAASRLYCTKLTSHPQIKGRRSKPQGCSFWSLAGYCELLCAATWIYGPYPGLLCEDHLRPSGIWNLQPNRKCGLSLMWFAMLTKNTWSCVLTYPQALVVSASLVKEQPVVFATVLWTSAVLWVGKSFAVYIWEWGRTVDQVAVWRCPVVEVLARTRCCLACCWGSALCKCLLWGAKKRKRKKEWKNSAEGSCKTNSYTQAICGFNRFQCGSVWWVDWNEIFPLWMKICEWCIQSIELGPWLFLFVCRNHKSWKVAKKNMFIN